MPRTRFEVISFRGKGFRYPENSIRALREALRSGATGVLVDLFLTKDLKWVGIVPQNQKRFPLAVERVHSRQRSMLKREVTPLEDILGVIGTFGADKRCYLCLQDKGEYRQVVRAVERHGLMDQIVMVSWSPEQLIGIHDISGEMSLGIVYPFEKPDVEAGRVIHKPRTRKGVELSYCKRERFTSRHGIGRRYEEDLSDLPDLPIKVILVPSLHALRKFVQSAHTREIRVLAYMVNKRLSVAVLRRRFIDGLVTTAPNVLVPTKGKTL